MAGAEFRDRQGGGGVAPAEKGERVCMKRPFEDRPDHVGDAVGAEGNHMVQGLSAVLHVFPDSGRRVGNLLFVQGEVDPELEHPGQSRDQRVQGAVTLEIAQQLALSVPRQDDREAIPLLPVELEVPGRCMVIACFEPGKVV